MPHAPAASARAHLRRLHGFEVHPDTVEADAVTTHDALPSHYHAADGNPVWADPEPVLLPKGAPDEMRPIAMLTDPKERVAAWKRLTERYSELIAMAAAQRRADVGRVFDQTVADGFRTSHGPGSWPEVDRRLGLNPGRAYRIWNGND